ncbi:ribosome biogenesis GTP-binding protein YihA/YsxC [Blattabacterium cuenoti]|uniref:ribosome biogenesis GTP-binding protein YihA/YsxC n=1 Tax=Blattabacterium cuenoti TaxID=1653831 RepID=UPI00163C07E8|nr:ribosome biogenesis GTP-binding protein YihA/YsxC [Blattabacterium cuenoti]
MKIFSATFEGSINQLNHSSILNERNLEYAFAGRSNVGKSSLINFLTHRKKLAKVSSSPGKTKLINIFLINHQWYLIDLPGYGFFPDIKMKREIYRIIKDYIFYRKKMTYLFLLIDCRRLIQQIDYYFIEMLLENHVQFCFIFTKMDKLKKYMNIDKKISTCLEQLEKNMGINPPKYFKISIKNQLEKKNIMKYIEQLNYKRKLIIPNS